MPEMSLSFTRCAAAPADQSHPKVNIIYTHSHDPLHCLQLQGVFVAVQHLFQVVMSEGGDRKLAHSMAVFLFLFFAHFFAVQETAKDSDYRGLKQEMQTCFTISIQCSKSIKVCKYDPEIILFEVGNPACKICKPLKLQLIKAQ